LKQDEADELMATDPDAFLLLSFARNHNGPDSEFMLANGLEERLPSLTRKRISGARTRLTGRFWEMIRRTTKDGGPALYRWLKKPTGQN
jgi:hypothetical protein